MSEEIEFEGKKYISSKRASDISGYAQDYIGQLARKNLIEARRMGGLWYILLDSLNAYERKADTYKPEFPRNGNDPKDTESFISFDGRNYLSAARASKSTGYHQDYIGQLARSGKLLSKRIGNRWYVDHQALLDHKREKDSLLAAVQVESVGIGAAKEPVVTPIADREPYFTYVTDVKEDFAGSVSFGDSPWAAENAAEDDEYFSPEQQIPIRILNVAHTNLAVPQRTGERRGKRQFMSLKLLYTGLAVFFVIGASFMLFTWKGGPLYSNSTKNGEQIASAGGLHSIASQIAEKIEELINPGITYVHQK